MVAFRCKKTFAEVSLYTIRRFITLLSAKNAIDVLVFVKSMAMASLY